MCVSRSTLESEFVAADFGLRTDGLPSLSLWRALFPHQLPLLFHEDSQAMPRVLKTSKKQPAMRYLHRTHRVSVSWVLEVCSRNEILLVVEEAIHMCDDVFTQAFTNAATWRHDF